MAKMHERKIKQHIPDAILADEMIFRKIYRGKIFSIQVVLQGEAFDSAAMKKKPSWIPCLDGKDIKVLLSPKNQHRRSTVSESTRYLNGLVMHRN